MVRQTNLWIFLLFDIILGCCSSLNFYKSFPTMTLSPHVLLLGPPCSGKGTQCKLLEKNYNLVHISTSNLIKECNNKDFQRIMELGQLIPDEIITNLVQQRLQKNDCKERGWVLDGFPRTYIQAKLLPQIESRIDAVFLLNTSDELVLERGLNRLIDPVTGAIYQRKFNPPPIEVEYRVIERNDDTEATLLTRLNQFKIQVKSISNLFHDRIHTIDSTRSSIDVNKDIEKVMNTFTRKK